MLIYESLPSTYGRLDEKQVSDGNEDEFRDEEAKVEIVDALFGHDCANDE